MSDRYLKFTRSGWVCARAEPPALPEPPPLQRADWAHNGRTPKICDQHFCGA